jgi:hypothetical protein
MFLGSCRTGESCPEVRAESIAARDHAGRLKGRGKSTGQAFGRVQGRGGPVPAALAAAW